MKIYSIKDQVMGEFMLPFYLQNDELAIRAFNNAVNDERSEAYTNYKDLQLYKIGEWNAETGELKSEIEYLAKGVDFKRRKNNEVLQHEQQASDNSNATNE